MGRFLESVSFLGLIRHWFEFEIGWNQKKSNPTTSDIHLNEKISFSYSV